jgi:hypothetical protein
MSVLRRTIGYRGKQAATIIMVAGKNLLKGKAAEGIGGPHAEMG